MTATSKPLADALYEHLLRNVELPSPAAVYVALHADGGSEPEHPGKLQADAFNNELSYGNYERQVITFDPPAGTDNAQGSSANSIIFPQVNTGFSPFDVTGLSIWTAPRGSNPGTSGLLLFAGPIDEVRTFQGGDAPLVAEGAVTAIIGEPLP